MNEDNKDVDEKIKINTREIKKEAHNIKYGSMSVE